MTSRRPRKVVRFVVLGAIALLTVLLLGLQATLQALLKTLTATLYALDLTWQLLLSLLLISGLAFLFAGLLSPLEALGWWAGWYGDEIEEMQAPGIVERPIADPSAIVRYVVYLDGIGQATNEYLPDVENFLNRLEAILPDNIVLVRGIMPYSAINRTLTDDDRPLARLWKLADYMQVSRYGSLMGTLTSIVINLRNTLVVAVSADRRYGPIYNQGIAQVIYNSLIHYGYAPRSGVPLTLIGFSGGGQMALGATPFLKRALEAPIEVISLAGVFCGSNDFLRLEHLFHLVGDKDPFERLGPVMFPGRWKIAPFSQWNRAKQMGKVTLQSLGAIGHMGAGGPLDETKFLPDGRSFLQQTLEIVMAIVQGNAFEFRTPAPQQPSNYERYQALPLNQLASYPIHAAIDLNWYCPIAPWVGRLILPPKAKRLQVRGAWLEVHHAPPDYQHLVGQIVTLRWSHAPHVLSYLRQVTKDVHFSADAEYSDRQGIVHPDRINHWQQVNPLESLAGSHPQDDVIVKLRDPVTIQESNPHQPERKDPEAQDYSPDQEQTDQSGHFEPAVCLLIEHDPVQITGRYYALVQFLRPVAAIGALPDTFQVAHYNRISCQFDGRTEVVRLPPVALAQTYGCYPSTTHQLEESPCNAAGWYIYGAPNQDGTFVVQAIAPRGLLRVQPDDVQFGTQNAIDYLRNRAWKNPTAYKGRTKSVLLAPRPQHNADPAIAPEQAAIAAWQAGDQALVIHVYGGIGGKRKEPAAKTPIFFGHFAYGVARVVREPLANELMFDIDYYQVYTHNTDGIIAGTLAWHRFLGDRQVGWLGTRPTCDLLIKLDAFTQPFDFFGLQRSALDALEAQLEAMTARYRIGDGTGGTYVGIAHNCSQDSNQALYAAIKRVSDTARSNPLLEHWLEQNPDQAARFEQLVRLGLSVKQKLLPFGSARADWEHSDNTLGISPEEDLLQGLLTGILSWRTLLPRLASETIARQFIQRGAQVWILRTNQVGGNDPEIEPIAPTPIGW